MLTLSFNTWRSPAQWETEHKITLIKKVQMKRNLHSFKKSRSLQVRLILRKSRNRLYFMKVLFKAIWTAKMCLIWSFYWKRYILRYNEGNIILLSNWPIRLLNISSKAQNLDVEWDGSNTDTISRAGQKKRQWLKFLIRKQ